MCASMPQFVSRKVFVALLLLQSIRAASLRRITSLEVPLAVHHGASRSTIGANQSVGGRLVSNGSNTVVQRSNRSSRSSAAKYSVNENWLPVVYPSGDSHHPLMAKHVVHKFTQQEVHALNSSQSSQNSTTTSFNAGLSCSPENTIFDLGFYDGADTARYLSEGYCVIAVEADPDLVNAAVSSYAVWIASGKMTIVNIAVAPNGAESWTTFYRNKCNREWNSFYKSVGCRPCLEPYTPAPENCDAVPVSAVACGELFTMFGVPGMMKLDIEGAEPGCFEAMQGLSSNSGPTALPKFASAEITQIEYLDTLHHMGYTYFKLVRQDHTHSGYASTSGAWGNGAVDCRTATVWRTYEEVRWEFYAIMNKGYDASDPCAGGICPIHGNGCSEGANIWYDVHVSRD